MKQHYFILVLAHSLHGRLRRIRVPHQVLYIVLALALVGGFSILGFVSSYTRMAWKVANYNSLRREAEELRVQYLNLQRVVNQTNEQLASLELLANEVFRRIRDRAKAGGAERYHSRRQACANLFGDRHRIQLPPRFQSLAL
jgi:hypothetical protein